jgi:SAM-dependent methyltransferase
VERHGVVSVGEVYDAIGIHYRDLRRPDPRIGKAILRALGSAATVVNVGAGTGSYEPRDRSVIAVEPSLVMIRQRSPDAAPVVRASAMALPFRDGAFEAGLAILTMHHWPKWASGLQELRRVARDRVVILTWDPDSPSFWLADYFPEIRDLDPRRFPPINALERELGPMTIETVPIPSDCTDGFQGAYWRRPAAYLDERVRSGISTFAKIRHVSPGIERLRRELDSGEWERKHGRVMRETELDLGYRLVIAS